MDEYIKKADIGLTDFDIVLCKGDYKEALKMLLDKIENMPAITIPGRKKGVWETKPEDIIIERFACAKCSVCKHIEPFGNYCRHCGAGMRDET